MSGFLQDLRYAARTLLRSPGFAVVAALSLALGIGANSTIFSVVSATLLAPLPYPDAGRLVMVWQDMRARGGPSDEWATPGNYFDWAAAGEIFEGVAAVRGWAPSLAAGETPEALVGATVTHRYFTVLGVAPALGRGFLSSDDIPGAPRVVVLSHALWQRAFGADPSVVGRTVLLSDEPHEVVGVMPAGFKPVVLRGATLWRPMRLDPVDPSRGAVVLRVVARLQPNVSMEAADARLGVLAHRLAEKHPASNRDVGIRAVNLREQLFGPVRTGLLVLLSAVAFVLLIACANVANLVMAHGSARAGALSIRMALGAGRGRLVQHLMAESVVLAGAGGLLGVLFAGWGVDALMGLVPEGRMAAVEIGVTWPVVVFTAAVSLVSALLFGLAPAWQLTRSGAGGLPLSSSGRGQAGPRGARMRRALVVAEVAVALVLLVGAGLLMRSFASLSQVDLGFDTRNLLVAQVNPPATRYANPQSVGQFYDRLVERAASIPGVEIAALTSVVPFGGDSDVSFEIEGMPRPENEAQTPVAWYRLVSERYFEAMRIPIVTGRLFTRAEPAPCVIVNETMAKRYWPNENPIGRRIRASEDSPWVTVIGIARDVKSRGPAATPQVEMFIPYWVMPERGIAVLLRTPGDPLQHAAALREAVKAADPALPVASLDTMQGLRDENVAEPRFFAVLLAAFALSGIALAAIGIYGVIAYTVAQRTNEIGVRVALGASRPDVLRLVVVDGMKLAVAGTLLGMAGAAALTRFMSSLLFAVTASDPLTFAATALGVCVVALLASYLPARAALRVDPLRALRAE
jgi:putative ABC transport system permease protein